MFTQGEIKLRQQVSTQISSKINKFRLRVWVSFVMPDRRVKCLHSENKRNINRAVLPGFDLLLEK